MAAMRELGIDIGDHRSKHVDEFEGSLSPNSRFVLRSAARLYLHANEPDRAHNLLLKAESTPFDPWLIAAELAIAPIAKVGPEFAYEAGWVLNSENYAPIHVTELASSLATLELADGNRRKARKLFQRALQSPTENSIAQVDWAAKQVGDPSRVAFDDAVIENLRAIPGVTAASLVSAMPLAGESWIEPLQRVDRSNQETPLINLRWVGPGYFEATGQKLVAGRFLEERDRNLNGAVLSEGEARAIWGSENPIGGRVRIEGRTFTVVGVVADSRNTSLKLPPAKMAYVHYRDRPPYATFFVVRAARSADALISGVRQAIWKYAPGVTIARVKTLDSQVTDSLATERFQTFVLVAFGASALLLAMLGIYGVLSYSVATRKQEIGVRMAIGATRSSIYALTLAEAGFPVLAGLATGLFASFLAGRMIRNLLYGIDVIDPAVILIVTGLFLVSAGAAAFLPARRAASVDPMDALRAE
jgi:predicted permease